VLMVLEFAQESLLPFGMLDYAADLRKYVDKLGADEGSNLYPQAREASGGQNLDINPLYEAVQAFEQAAHKIDDWETAWYSQVMGSSPTDPDSTGNTNGLFESGALGRARHVHNEKVSDFETNLLDLPRPGNEEKDRQGETATPNTYGIPGREQFKHVVFGPQMWSGYEEAYFPFIRDALERGNFTEAQQMVKRTARVLTLAGKTLAAD